MSPTVFPALYFGPVAYFAGLIQANEIQLERHENFIKQTNRSRCEIAGPNGRQRLTIPVKTGLGSRGIEHCSTDLSQLWPRKHWRSIETAYHSAPYFEHYQPVLSEFFNQNFPTLLDWNAGSIKLVSKLLRLELNWSWTKSFTPLIANDPRTVYAPKGKGAGKIAIPTYGQVFEDRHPFHHNLSILDLVLNEGPATEAYLLDLKLPTE